MPPQFPTITSAGSSASIDDLPTTTTVERSTRKSRLKRRRREKSARHLTTKIKGQVPIPSFSFTPATNDGSDDEESKNDDIKKNSFDSVKRMNSSSVNVEEETQDSQRILSLLESKSQVSKCQFSQQEPMATGSEHIEMHVKPSLYSKSSPIDTTKTHENGEIPTKSDIFTSATNFSVDSFGFQQILSRRGTIDVTNSRFAVNSINDGFSACEYFHENDPKSEATLTDPSASNLAHRNDDHGITIAKSPLAERVDICNNPSLVAEMREQSSRLHDKDDSEMIHAEPVKTRPLTSKPALKPMNSTKSDRKAIGRFKLTSEASTTAAESCSTLDSKLSLQGPLSLGLTKVGAKTLFQKKTTNRNSIISIEDATTEIHGDVEINVARKSGKHGAENRLIVSQLGPKDCARNRNNKATKNCIAGTEENQVSRTDGANDFSLGITSNCLKDCSILDSLHGDSCLNPFDVQREESHKTEPLKTPALAEKADIESSTTNKVTFEKSPFRGFKSSANPWGFAETEINENNQLNRWPNENKQLSQSGKVKPKFEPFATSKYFESDQTKKDVIEIDDDDDEVEEVVVEKRRIVAKKKTSSVPNKNTPPVKQPHKSSTSTATKAQSAVSVPVISRAPNSSSDESSAATEKLQKPVTKKNRVQQLCNGRSTKRIKKSSRSKDDMCFACSACKCHLRDGSAATSRKISSFINLSGSDARVEQSLVNRLKQIERNLAWTQSMRHNVARDLQKHRNAMLKKWETESSSDQLRFLPDADVSEEWGGLLSKRSVEANEVGRARIAAFRKNGSQPTLTQGFGFEGSKRSGDEGGGDQKNGCRENSDRAVEMFNIERIDEEIESIRSDDSDCERADLRESFLSCWSSPGKHREANQILGSMDDFYDAASRCKEKRLTDLTRTIFGDTILWANATARSIRISKSSPDKGETRYRRNIDYENPTTFSQSSYCNDGLDTLITLFDDTIPKKHDSFSGDTDQTDWPCLTPGGKKAVADIENSLMSNKRKLEAVETICPHWRENIEFIHLQKDPDEVDIALERVKIARSELNDMKTKILQAFFERDSVLDVFQQSLIVAKERMDEEV
ncbi:hypothetical protein ACHAXS_013715 [Conticribra weissflogii]